MDQLVSQFHTRRTPFQPTVAATLSQRELMTIAFEEAGLRPKIVGSKGSGYFVLVIGRFQPDLGEVAEILDQFESRL